MVCSIDTDIESTFYMSVCSICRVPGLAMEVLPLTCRRCPGFLSQHTNKGNI